MSLYRDAWEKQRKFLSQISKRTDAKTPLPPTISKADLKRMLEEAAQNTARMPHLNKYEK